MIEGSAKMTKVKVIAVKITGEVTEIGVWASHDSCLWRSHDKALAELIAEKIKEEARRPANMPPCVTGDAPGFSTDTKG